MTAKCAICQEAPYSFLWQPTLGDDTLTFYTPGYQIRPFMAVRICNACIEKVRSGETVYFEYKHVLYQANAQEYEPVPVEYATLTPVDLPNGVIAECSNPIATLVKKSSRYNLHIEPNNKKYTWTRMNVVSDEEAIRLANIALIRFVNQQKIQATREQEQPA